MKRLKFLVLLLTALCSLLPALLQGQVDTAWIRRYNGSADSVDFPHALTFDALGNIYISGASYGIGTDCDYATLKYNADGGQQWVARYNGPANGWDASYSIAVGSGGSVYVTGISRGTGQQDDYATIKYNAEGIQQWLRRYNGVGNSDDWAFCVAVDSQNNVYVTGMSYISSTNFDYDYVTIKYNSVGDEQWVTRYDGPGHSWDWVKAMVVDEQSNVYVTGASLISGIDWDYTTVKYNSNGVQQWEARYNGPTNRADCPSSITIDEQGNVYVTGKSIRSDTEQDYATIKYNSNGVEQWVRIYNSVGNGYDEARAIAIDGQGGVYVTGNSATVKYNSEGVEQWVRIMDLAANSIAVDNQNNVYVTGYYIQDYGTKKYNSDGILQWVARYNGPGNSYDEACAIAVDSVGNVYVTGCSYGSVTGSDYLTIKYVQMQRIEEERLTLDAKCLTLEMYPNPAKAFFTLRLPQSADRLQIKIFDVTGKLVKEIGECLRQPRNDKIGELRVSLKGISPGIYFLQLTNDPETKKLVITK